MILSQRRWTREGRSWGRHPGDGADIWSVTSGGASQATRHGCWLCPGSVVKGAMGCVTLMTGWLRNSFLHESLFLNVLWKWIRYPLALRNAADAAALRNGIASASTGVFRRRYGYPVNFEFQSHSEVLWDDATLPFPIRVANRVSRKTLRVH